jgi:hypothetical protein
LRTIESSLPVKKIVVNFELNERVFCHFLILYDFGLL